MAKETKLVPADVAKKRLDEFLAEAFGVTRSTAKKWIAGERVQVNGEMAHKAGYQLKPGVMVEVDIPRQATTKLPENLPAAEIVAETAEFLAVRKPAGLVTHPDHSHQHDSLVQRILQAHLLSPIGLPDRPGVVHRLDKDTSGILLFAKTEAAHHELQQIFAERRIRKEYLALVHGNRLPAHGTVESPITRDDRERTRMTVSGSEKARHAVSHFDVIKTASEASLLRIVIETGRTHQIRVHLSAIGHPVVGDVTYGITKADRLLAKKYGKIPRLMLHARSLGFEFEGQEKHYEADPPQDFADFLRRIGIQE